MDREQKIYLNSFREIQLSSSSLQTINRFFKQNFKRAWLADMLELKNSGLGQPSLKKIDNERIKTDPYKLWKKLEDSNTQIITIEDNEYPEKLKNIPDPPFLLYCRGNISLLGKKGLAIVGTRKMTEYGNRSAIQIARGLAVNDIVIVSGLAKGIDSIAHQTALEFGGGTIAVLGTGVLPYDIYPTQNKKLAEQIVEKNGLLLSEYPAGTEPRKEHFPQRNRIISGLSDGVLIVEAPQKSGAMITAFYAIEHNRDVYAIPGSIFSTNSHGPNFLIQKGARVVTSAEDILTEFGIDVKKDDELKPRIRPTPTNQTEEAIIEVLWENEQSADINQIAEQASIPIPKLLSAITIMELSGKIRDLGGKKYILN